MNNVQLFELFAAKTFAICYERFPLAGTVSLKGALRIMVEVCGCAVF